jgi:phosphatidylserine/phosphatidylglycerophosphate/cardiolipin synthase-like enzyme
MFDTMFDVTRRGGQVVLAANHGPEGLEGLDEVLRSKLKGAATCEINEPDESLRRRILDMRVQHHALANPGFSVAPEALDMIANRLHKAGVRVFVYPGMTHVKALLVDDWACVGSGNLNQFGLRLCQEQRKLPQPCRR